MTNFRLAQARAQRASRSLIAIYVAAVGFMTVMVLPLVAVLSALFLGIELLLSRRGFEHGPEYFALMWRAGTWIVSTDTGRLVGLAGMAAATVVILLASLSRFLAMREGGRAVAESIGARRIPPNTDDPDERRVLNIVEEMAIASAIPVPPVYLMRAEQSVNAFAAGYSPSDAVVGLTDGSIRRLSRDQLQGVIAHEFGHIRSGDMRLNIRLIGLLHGIVVVGHTGWILMNLEARRNPLFFLGLGMAVVGGCGSLLGSIIRAAINRGREHLADACAVEFTRLPDGLAGALKIVGGQPSRGMLADQRADECSHMMFVQGFSTWLARLTATHPPLEDRIRRLDPHWDGEWLPGRPLPVEGPAAEQVTPPIAPYPLAVMAPVAAAVALADAVTFADALGPEEIVSRMSAAHDLLESLDPALINAAHDTGDARLLVCAMLLDPKAQVAAAQHAIIARALGAAAAGAATGLREPLRRAGPPVRLPLLEVALGSLAALTPEQYRQFRALVALVVRSDQRVSLFEWCLERLLLTHLDRRHSDARPPSTQYYSLKGLAAQCSTLLSAVAHAGRSGGAAARSLEAAARTLGVENLKLQPPAACTPERLTDAMDRLALAHERLRKQVVVACAEIIGADGTLTDAEAELLRVIADGLDSPLAMPLASPRHPTPVRPRPLAH